jgi:parvulin-like peptidyl-prolyl isomerase
MILGTIALILGPAGAADPPRASGEAGAEKEAAELTLAVVDGEPITLADLQEGFGARHAGHGSLLAGEVILRDVLKKAISERLIIQEGYRMGLPEEPSIIEAVNAYRDIVLLEVLERTELHEAANPSDEEIQAVYNRLPVQRRLSLIETPTKERAQEALGRLKIGEEFGEVARTLSTHRSRTRGGDLGWVVWGNLDPAVEKIVFESAVGELVGPVSVEGRFTLVKIVDETEGEPPPFEKVSDNIREILRQRNRTRLFRDLIAEIRKEHPPEEDEEALSALVQGGGPAGGAPVPAAAAVLMRTATGLELTAGRVRRRAEKSGVPLEEAYRAAAVDALLIDEARRRIKPDTAVERRIQAFADAKVRREVEKLTMPDMTSVTQKDIRAHYESEVESYEAPTSYHLNHILLATEAEAKEIRQALKEGADFADLAKSRSIDGESAPSGGDLGWLQAPEYTSPGDKAGGILGLKAGEISEVIQTGQGFAVVKVVEIRAGAAPPYEKVKLEVARRLLKARQQEATEKFIQRLREYAEVTVDEEAVSRGVHLLDEIAKTRLSPEAGGSRPANHP